MNIKKSLGIFFLFNFYFFHGSERKLKNHLFGQMDQKKRLDLLRNSVEASQGKSQDLYLEALAFEIDGNKNKADEITFQACLASQSYANKLEDKKSLTFALNSLLNISFLDQKIKDKIKQELVFEVQTNIKKVLIQAQEDEVESKLQFYEMYNSVQDIYNNCLAVIEDNLDKKEMAIFFNHLETIKSFLDNSRMQESVRLLLLEHKDEKKSIIAEHQEGLESYFQKFHQLIENIKLRAFFKSAMFFSQLEKEENKREELVDTEFFERRKIYQNMMIHDLLIMKKDFEKSRKIHQFNTEKKSFLSNFLNPISIAKEEFYEQLHAFSDKFECKRLISSIKINEENNLFDKILNYSENINEQKVTKEKIIKHNDKVISSSNLVFDGEHQKERGFLSISALEDQGVDFSGLDVSTISYGKVIFKILNFHASSNKCLKCIILPKEDKVYFEVVTICPLNKINKQQEKEDLSLSSSAVTGESSSVTRESSDLTTPPPLPRFKPLFPDFGKL